MHIARASGGTAIVEWIGTICVRGNLNGDPLRIEIAPKEGFLLDVDGQHGSMLLKMTVAASEVQRMRRVAPQLFPDPQRMPEQVPLKRSQMDRLQLAQLLEDDWERHRAATPLRNMETSK